MQITGKEIYFKMKKLEQKIKDLEDRASWGNVVDDGGELRKKSLTELEKAKSEWIKLSETIYTVK